MNKRKALDKRDIFLLARDLTGSSLNFAPLESAIVQMPQHTKSKSEEGMGVFIKQPWTSPFFSSNQFSFLFLVFIFIFEHQFNFHSKYEYNLISRRKILPIEPSS
jgi:hypothetical protein